MMEAAMDHDGFSFIECLSECVEFYEGAFDAANPRKGGMFKEIPKDHDVTDETAAYKLAGAVSPVTSAFFTSQQADQKREGSRHQQGRDGKGQGLKHWQILQKNFDRMK